MELDYDVVGVPGGPSSEMMALLPPRVNVSAQGEIPVTLQVFRIRLPCSGVVSAEIPLALRLNVTAPPGTRYNDTVLVFKRNKICLKGTCRYFQLSAVAPCARDDYTSCFLQAIAMLILKNVDKANRILFSYRGESDTPYFIILAHGI